MKNLLSFRFIALVIIFLLFVGQFVAMNSNPNPTFIEKQFQTYLTKSYCDEPIYYKIGSIDPKFELTEADFLTTVKESANLWHQSSGRSNLLIHDQANPKSISINLIYDERALLNSEIHTLKDQLEQEDQSIEEKLAAFEKRGQEFENRMLALNRELNEYNQVTSAWNDVGGAPEAEYQRLVEQKEKLNAEQQALQQEAESLNQTARELNVSTKDYNTEVRKLNTTIKDFGQALTQKPEKGLFDPQRNTIDIYFTNSQEELIHTLSHEMGHALGILHTEDEKSIMYPFSTETVTLASEDLQALETVCAKRFLNIPFREEIQQFYEAPRVYTRGFF